MDGKKHPGLKILSKNAKEEDERMCQALKELMKEEIAEEVTKGRADEKLVDIKNLMNTMKWTAAQAMQALKIPESDQSKYSAML